MTKNNVYLPRNLTSNIQQKADKVVSKLEKENLISAIVAKSLRTYDSLAPRFYALPKIHKPT